MLTLASIRNELLFDTDSFFLLGAAASSMDRYNSQINNVYREVVNDRLWEWRLYTVTLSGTAGVFSMLSTTAQIHSLLDHLPTTSPDVEIGGWVEDRSLRTLTFTVETTRTSVRMKHFIRAEDMVLDADEPILPFSFRQIIYHGAAKHFLNVLERDRESTKHGKDYIEWLRQLRVHNTTQVYRRNPPQNASVPMTRGGRIINLKES